MRISKTKIQPCPLRLGSRCDRSVYALYVGQRSCRKGFTLLEVLVSLAVSGILLTGVAIVLRDTFIGVSALREVTMDAQFQKAVDVMGADVRGILSIELVEEGSDTHGRPLAQFTSTNSLNAIKNGFWSGSARICYRLADQEGSGRSLWRSESFLNDPMGQKTWTCLLENLFDCRIEIHCDGELFPWPKTKDKTLRMNAVNGLRINVMSLTTEGKTIWSLPTVILPIMVDNTDGYKEE